MIDLSNLTAEEFELLIALLLGQEGYQITDRARAGTRAPDFEAISPNGEHLLIEVKHYKGATIGPSIIRQFAGDIERYRLQKPDTRGLLIFSGDVSKSALKAIADSPELHTWSGAEVLARLLRHADAAKALKSVVRARQRLVEGIPILSVPATKTPLYATRLGAIPKGQEGWKEYERQCTEILTAIFASALGPPDIQNRSDDGLDIMDAIFPIRAIMPPWSLVRSEYATRFVVAEFKNYKNPIGKKEVDAIAQYLWDRAQRRFGILVTRLPPSNNALLERRQKWLVDGKMIVILTDDELIEMMQLKEEGQEPFDVINMQLEDFFRTLSP